MALATMNTMKEPPSFADLLTSFRLRAGLSQEPLARSLVADFKWNTATLTHLPEYKTLPRQLRTLPDFRRIADSTPAAGIPSPSFIMNAQHSELGPLALRTVSTTFSGIRDHHIS